MLISGYPSPVAKGSLGGTNTYPHALDACTGDLLAVIKLQSLQASAVLQVLQRGVRDEKAVVQLQDSESLVPTGAAAQVQNPLICDELTVGQALWRKGMLVPARKSAQSNCLL